MVTTRLRGVLVVAAAALLLGCAAAIEEARHEAEDKVPRAGPVDLPLAWSLSGGRVAAASSALGVPVPSTAAPFVRFVRPVSVAARGADIAVVDGGTSTLYRVDPVSQLMVRLPVGPAPNAKVEVLPDRSLLLLDGGQRRVSWFGPDGRLQQELSASSIDFGRPAALTRDGAATRIVVADALYGQVIEFQPAGRAARVVPLRDVSGAGATALLGIAANARGWYLLDGGCRCVLIVDRDGRVLGREGVDELAQPVALAVDASNRVYVADQGAQTLRVFAHGRAMQSFTYRQLGVSEIVELKVDDATLYLATGSSGRIDARHIVARFAGGSR